MEYVNVKGEKVPKIGIGTWQSKGGECAKAVRTALEEGYRHIDTAQAYGNEDQVGKGINESSVGREDIWLTTKLWRSNLNRRDLKDSVDESLEKLGTDYVDLLLIHWPFDDMDLETVLDEMNDLVKEGKVRNIGVSNFTPKQMERAQQLCEAKIFTNQVEYHPFLNQDDIVEKCRDMDTMLTAYSPLARGEVVENDLLKEIGGRYNKSAAQVALRWLLQQKNVCAIPKATSRDHIVQNFNVFDFELSDEEMAEIRKHTGRNERKVDPDFGPWN